MRFIELHEPDKEKPFLVNINKIDLIKEVQNWDGAYAHTQIDLEGLVVKCRETSHEIMIKIRG